MSDLDALKERAGEIRKLCQGNKYTDAVKMALEGPPFGHKAGENTDVRDEFASQVINVLTVSNVKDAAIDEVISQLSEEEGETLMKYLYAGLGNPEEKGLGILLKWHAKVSDAKGLGSVVRALTEKKRNP